jgi:hypothetical protein
VCHAVLAVKACARALPVLASALRAALTAALRRAVVTVTGITPPHRKENEMNSLMQLIDNRFGSNQTLNVRFERYRNGQRAILLETPEGESWTDATRAVGCPLPADCVAIKDYSENEGLLALLVKAGVLEPQQLATIPSGFVELPVHRLTRAALAHAEGA